MFQQGKEQKELLKFIQALKGDYRDRRECLIEPDWLLIYKIDSEKGLIVFERTGSHADLFG